MDTLSDLLSRPLPPYLYHYTSVSGLHGIIESETIWASMIHYLNDAEEFRIAITVFRGMLLEESIRIGDGQLQRLAAQLVESLASLSRVFICVCSFTGEGDLLSQWRAYCPSDGGYSIGFLSEPLKKSLSDQAFDLIPCVYDQEGHRRVMGPIVQKALSSLQMVAKTKYGSGDLVAKWGEFDFVRSFCRIAPIIKHESFREEQEWRAISGLLGTHQLEFRPGRSLLVPYYKVKLHRQITLKIVVGPQRHSDLAAKSLENFLLKKVVERDLPFERPQISRIPLRQL